MSVNNPSIGLDNILHDLIKPSRCAGCETCHKIFLLGCLLFFAFKRFRPGDPPFDLLSLTAAKGMSSAFNDEILAGYIGTFLAR